MGPAHYTLTGGGRLPDPDPASPATVFFLTTVSFYQLQWAPLDMEGPLSGTPEAGWRVSSLVSWLSKTCEAGWRASSLSASAAAGVGRRPTAGPVLRVVEFGIEA